MSLVRSAWRLALVAALGGCGGRVADEPPAPALVGEPSHSASYVRGATSATDVIRFVRRDPAQNALTYVRLQRGVGSRPELSVPDGFILGSAIRCSGADIELDALTPAICEQSRQVVGTMRLADERLSVSLTLAFAPAKYGAAEVAIHAESVPVRLE